MLGGSSICPNRKQLTPLCPLNSDSKSVQAFEALVQTSCPCHRLHLCFLYRAPCAWTLEAAKAHDESVMTRSTQCCLRKCIFADLDCKDQLLPGFLPITLLQQASKVQEQDRVDDRSSCFSKIPLDQVLRWYRERECWGGTSTFGNIIKLLQQNWLET